MSLSPAFLDEVRTRTTLSALVGRSVKLQRAGREFRACCPFHNEKSPSFYVNDEKGFYHCFGCGAHGDAIKWLTEHQGLPFIDAVKELSQAAGLDMPAQDPRAARKAERAKSLHDVMAAAAKWFEEQLHGLDGAEARALLERRAIRADTARTFGLGFAPDSRGRLRQALADYGDAMLIEAGLLIAVDGKEPYDRFRGRLMIPIRDARGRVIAFGGRIIGAGEPKYLNSPETPLFDKGRTLYNLDRAAPPARQAKRVIAVEGYMDVIALAQAGFGEAVAPLGTALTETQLERLWRIADVPVLCFDGDAAGQKAALRAAERALPVLAPGRSLAFTSLPAGQDPDDFIRASGTGAMGALLEDSRPLADFIWSYESASVTQEAGPDARAALQYRLKEHAERIVDPIRRREYQFYFNRRYYDVFGLRSRDANRLHKAIVDAGPREPREGFDSVVRRAVLHGLSRYPEVLRDYPDRIGELPIPFPDLSKWRDILLDISVEYPRLTEDTIEQILATRNLTAFQKRCYQRDLAFSFYFHNVDREKPAADLKLVIDTLIAEHKFVQVELDAQRRMEETLSEATLTERLQANEAASKARQRLMDWLEEMAEAA